MASQSSQPPSAPSCSTNSGNAALSYSQANLSQDLFQTLFPGSNLCAPTPFNTSPPLPRRPPPPTYPSNGAHRSTLQSFTDETLTEALEILLARGDARNNTCENEQHLARLTGDLSSSSLPPARACRAQDTDSLLDAALPFLNQGHVERSGPARQIQAPTPATNHSSNGNGQRAGSLPRTCSVPGYRDHVKLLDALLSKEARRHGLQVPAPFINNLGVNQSTGTTSQVLEQQAKALSESFALQKSAALTPKPPTRQSFSRAAPSLPVSRTQPQQTPMQRRDLPTLPQRYGFPLSAPSQPELAMATLSAAALSARLPRQLSESPSSDKAEQSEDQRESFPGSTEKSAHTKKKMRRRHADRVSELEAQISALRKTTSEAMEQLQKARETIRVLEKRNRELSGEASDVSESDPASLVKRQKIKDDEILDEEPTLGVLMHEEDPENLSGEQLHLQGASEGNHNAQYLFEDLLEGNYDIVC